MLKEDWKDNVGLFVRMHGSKLFDSDMPSLEKVRCSFIPRASQLGGRLTPPPFSIMFI